MYNVGIIGASGFTGYELIKILRKHPGVKLKALNSENHAGTKVCAMYPDFEDKELEFTNFSTDEINKSKIDLVFLAVPNKTAMKLVPKLKCKAIDLSADYRFKRVEEYEKVYEAKHEDAERKAAYGLPELFRKKIMKSKVLANPGCYVTASILAAYPVQKLAKYIVFDCKSGYSGAGKESAYVKDPSILKDNIQAYKLTNHRHRYEIAQFIKTKMSFTPHVIDTFRGMMCTAHFLLKKPQTPEGIKQIFKQFYANEPFVEISDKIPDLHDVQGTNKCVIGGFEIDGNNQLVVVSVIDNLLKGASGQAVQNMNLMLGLEERSGLEGLK